MKQNLCVVVIPIHSPNPSLYELISFAQCFKILGDYPIKIVAPAGLALAAYKHVVPQFDTIFISPHWQSSLPNYNKLKTSRFFYRLFSEYEFLLTYELDAFVFKNDLPYWCSQNYDYIGAPWFEDFDNPKEGAQAIGVGNSGFSLRKVKPIQDVLKNMFCRDPLDKDNSLKTLLKVYAKLPVRWLTSKMTGENHNVVKDYWLSEDRFFSMAVPLVYSDFTVAPVVEATRFSFEVMPERLFALNNQQLPMGCHAWWRYNLPFWKPHIEEFGYKL